MKEKESEVKSTPNSLRRETWIHPDSGRREHRTTSAVTDSREIDSEEEDLAILSSVDVSELIELFSLFKASCKLLFYAGQQKVRH